MEERRLLGVMFAASALAVATSAWSGWTSEVIAGGGHFGGESSVARDAAGHSIIAYAGDAVRVARWDGSAWQFEVVDASDCGYTGPSIALDPAGNPGISYHDAANDHLKFARWNGSSWDIHTIDANGRSSSLEFDRSGAPVISYQGYSTCPPEPGSWCTVLSVNLARWSGSRWDIEVVIPPYNCPGWVHCSAAGEQTSLALDSNDDPAIAWASEGSGSVARRIGATWANYHLDGFDTAYDIDVAFDSADVPHLARYSENWMHLGVVHSTWNGSGWDSEIVDENGSTGLSLAIDASDELFLSYPSYGSPNWTLQYAHSDGTGWNIVDIDTGDVSGPTSLALDASSDPVITYERRDRNPALAHARFNGATWDLETVDQTQAIGDAEASVAVDPSGVLAVSYIDQGDSLLSYARWDGTSWQIAPVTSIAGWSASTSLGFDGSGRPAIAYVDDTVKVAWWDGTSWQFHDVDTGRVTSIAIDDAGNPAVAFAETNGDVRFASWNGLAFDVIPVDDGSRPSLAFDDAGRPAIAYETSVQLKVARWNGSDWDIENVDDGAINRLRPSLAFAPDGHPAVSSVQLGLWYSKWDGSAWQTTQADSRGDYTSLAFDAAGNPAISYLGKGLLPRYAYWNGRRWRTEAVDDARIDSLRLPLAFDGNGVPVIAYDRGCSTSLQLARRQEVAAVVYRGVVADVTAGWRAASLPLDAANDDETAPFPIDTAIGRFADDTLGSTAPLTLYRLLVDGTQPAGNVLRMVERPGALEAHY